MASPWGGTMRQSLGAPMEKRVRMEQAEFTKAYRMEQVVNYLNRGGDVNVTSFSKQGHTLLMMACVEDHEKLTAELCRRGANVDLKARKRVEYLNSRPTCSRAAARFVCQTNGKTALMHAAVMGHPQCAQHLVDAGSFVASRACRGVTTAALADARACRRRRRRAHSRRH
jgi:ankyrin repeat protein